MAFDQQKYKNDFRREKYYKAEVLIPKNRKDDVKARAAESGESVGAYVKRLISDDFASAGMDRL